MFEVAIRKQPFQVTEPIGMVTQKFAINFDGCRHASGRQRAYCQCPFHKDEHCRRYVFVHHYASPRDAAAWLLAWAFAEPRSVNKGSHYEQVPPQAAIDAAFALL